MAKKKADHSERTRKLYEADGWLIGKVESKNMRVLGGFDYGLDCPHCHATFQHPANPGVLRVRFFGTKDLWGIADWVAIRGGTFALVQHTSYSNHAARRRKIEASPEAAQALREGAEIHIVSWGRPAGKTTGRYEVKVEVLKWEERSADTVFIGRTDQ